MRGDDVDRSRHARVEDALAPARADWAKRTRQIAGYFGDVVRLLLVLAIAYLIAAWIWGWRIPVI
jgi:hypothetical protein